MWKKIKNRLWKIWGFIVLVPKKVFGSDGSIIFNNISKNSIMVSATDYGTQNVSMTPFLIWKAIFTLLTPIIFLIGIIVYLGKSNSSKKRKFTTAILILVVAAVVFFLGKIIFDLIEYKMLNS